MDRHEIWKAICVIKSECTNNDNGEICEKHTDCLSCWYTELSKELSDFNSEEEKQKYFFNKLNKGDTIKSD